MTLRFLKALNFVLAAAICWIAATRELPAALPRGVPTCGPALNFTSGTLPGGSTFAGGANTSYYNSSFQLVNSVNNTARFTYKPDTGAGPYLILEPAKTNLMTQSEAMNTSPWGTDNTTFTAGQTDPRGGTAAIFMKETNTNTNHGQTASVSTAPLASTQVTYSVYVKQNTGSRAAYVRISDNAFAGWVAIVVDPSTGLVVVPAAVTGTYSGPVSSSIQKINISGNVWYRVSISATSNAGTSTATGSTYLWSVAAGNTTYTGDNASGINVFGAQASPTSTITLANSYIPTTSSSVTSTADSLSFTVPAGCQSYQITYDDFSNQVFTGSGPVTVNASQLNRPWLRSIQFIATPTGSGGGGTPVTCTGTLDFTTGSLPAGTTFAGGAGTSYYNSSKQLVNSVNNTARFTFKPDTGAGPFIVLEPVNTNYAPQSEAFSTSPWTTLHASTVSGKTDPRGGTSAFKVQEDSSNTQHLLTATNSTPSLASVPVTVTAFVKQDTGSRNFGLAIFDSAFAGGVSIFINPSTGAITSSPQTQGTYTGTATGSSQPVNIGGNQYYRVSASAISNSGSGTSTIQLLLASGTNSVYTGDGSSGVDVFGVTVSPNSSISLADSYIPTTSGTASSTADQVSFTMPTGCQSYIVTFDDASTQTIAASGSVTVNPSQLNRPWVKNIVYSASGGGGPTPPVILSAYNPSNYSCLRNIYVETAANGGLDSNNGLALATPIATLQHYNDALTPTGGDCVLVGPGTFNGFTASHGGSANTATGYIVVKSRIAPTAGANGRLSAWTAFIVPSSAGAFNTIDLSTGVLGTHDYWLFDGLDIQGPPNDAGGGGNGIEFETANFFGIMNSNVHNAAGGGIACFIADYCYIANNNVFDSAWFNTSADSGIDVGGLVAHDTAPIFHNVISRNLVSGVAEGPAVTSAASHTDGNCFIADSFAAYAQSTLVDDNVFVRCGGVGLHVFNSKHITAINNASYGNLTDFRHNSANNGIIDNFGNGNTDNHFCNNWAIYDGAYNSSNLAILDSANGGTNSNISYFNNMTFNGTAGQGSVLITGGSTASIVNGINGNILGTNPLITAPSTSTAFADWHLQPGSAGLLAGSVTACGGVTSLDFYGNARYTAGAQVDIGPTQGSSAPSWTLPSAKDEAYFGAQLFTDAGGVVGQGLVTQTNSLTGATDLLPNSPPGYPYLQYTGTQVRVAYNIPLIGPGLLDEPGGVTNFLLNSAAPATQTTGSLGTGTYVLWGNMEASGGFPTAGSLVLSNGTATGCIGTATQLAPVTFTITVAGTCTVTVSGKVYFEQLENVTAAGSGTVQGFAGTSGIVTAGATVTRTADFYKLGGAALATSIATPASMFFYGKGSSLSAANTPNMLTNNISTSMARGAASNTSVNNYDVTNTALSAATGAGNVFGPIGVALGWDNSGRSFVVNGGTVASDAVTEGNTFTTIALGDTSAGGNAYAGLILRFSDWNSRLSNASLQGLTNGIGSGAGGGSNLFNWTANFSGQTAGTPFEVWNGVQTAVFSDPSITAQYNNDAQSSTNHMWFVAKNVCGRTSSVLESLLPAGDLGQNVGVAGYGSQNKLVVRLADPAASPTDTLNLSYDMCLDANYYLGSLAKFAGQIGFGDDTQTSTSSMTIIYECRPQPPPANPGCATGATGSTGPPRLNYAYNISGGNGDFTSPDLNVITVNTWHNFKLSLTRGPNGSTKFYEDGVLQFSHAVSNICNGASEPANPGCTTVNGNPWIQFSTWFGGGSAVYSPPVNAIAYFDNIRVWSGTGP